MVDGVKLGIDFILLSIRCASAVVVSLLLTGPYPSNSSVQSKGFHFSQNSSIEPLSPSREGLLR